jgi:hypothetical protein
VVRWRVFAQAPPSAQTALFGARPQVVIDVTQTTEYLSWEIAEALTLRDPECVLLVCSLEGYPREKLGLAKTVLKGLEKEVPLRGEGGRQLVQRFKQVLPPLLYATFPSSFVFRVSLVRRLRACLGTRRRKYRAQMKAAELMVIDSC